MKPSDVKAFCAVIVFSISSALQANDIEKIPSAYIDYAVINGVPPEVLYAVSLQESVDYNHVFVARSVGKRPWPWTLNVRGKSLRFKSKEDACAVLKSSLEVTKIIDVGLTQLNVRYQPQLFGENGIFQDPCDGLNPYDNLNEAAKLLSERFNTHKDWVIAAGRYHRPAGGAPAAKYSQSVARKLQSLGFSHYQYQSANR